MKIVENHVMIDLETMGNGPNAAITAIGAVRFTTVGLAESFYEVVDLQSSVDAGMELDASTVMWWLKQGDEARMHLLQDASPLKAVLESFSEWLVVEAKVWDNGASFDNVILASTYRACKLPIPWNFWDELCYRTMKNMMPHITMKRTGTHHNALDDARSQAEHLIRIIKRLPA